MPWFCRPVVILALLFAAAGPAIAAPTLSVSPVIGRADVGAQFPVAATVTNPDETPTSALTAHLEIIDPTRAGSVDAEDWVPDLNIPVGSLAPGQSARVAWDLTPISGGDFAVYVVVLAEDAAVRPGEPVSASPAIPVAVREVRSLNAGGALPVAIAVPLVILVALVAVRRRSRRRGAAAIT